MRDLSSISFSRAWKVCRQAKQQLLADWLQQHGSGAGSTTSLTAATDIMGMCCTAVLQSSKENTKMILWHTLVALRPAVHSGGS